MPIELRRKSLVRRWSQPQAPLRLVQLARRLFSLDGLRYAALLATSGG